MKTVQLTPNIRYASLNDEDGVFGLFIVHLNGDVIATQEVCNQDEFKVVYDELVDRYGV